MCATFIQSTPDHVVNSALKIVTGEMWSSAAGESSHRLTEGMALFEGAICRRQLFRPGFRHLHFRPQAGHKIRAGKPLFMLLSGKGRNSLVVEELHHPGKQRPSETPRWQGIPERGPFTGNAIVGAVGSGRTPSRTCRSFIWG